MHSLQNASFRGSTLLTVKFKIDSLGNLGHKVGFSCFDWFRIGPLNGILVSEITEASDTWFRIGYDSGT